MSERIWWKFQCLEEWDKYSKYSNKVRTVMFGSTR